LLDPEILVDLLSERDWLRVDQKDRRKDVIATAKNLCKIMHSAYSYTLESHVTSDSDELEQRI